MKKHVLAVLTVTALAAVSWPAVAGSQARTTGHPSSGPNAVITWNDNAGDAALAACIAPGNDPLHEARMYAITHVAVHDALNAIKLRSQPYAYHPPHLSPSASPDAAVASAARNTLIPLIQGLPPDFDGCKGAGVASVESDYAAALAAISNGHAKQRGIEVGQAAAQTILADRAGDGSNQPLVVPDCPVDPPAGVYRCTPGTPLVFLPQWGDVTPFVLKSNAQFLPGPPYALTSKKYAADFNEVKQLGGDDVTTPSDRTADQTQIALFWVESSPLAWNRMAREVAVDRHVGLWDSARLFGLLNMAMSDGYVGSWYAKFDVYNFWRPVTAIQLADMDGNPNTEADPTWTPLVTTPPIPDHDSGHGVEGGAASQVMQRFFGTDHVSFTLCSLTLPDGQQCGQPGEVTRSYHSFTQAADENGLSRILVGFHFRRAVDAGIKHGSKIADRAVNRFMQPVG